jgi:hypothetical protein
LILGSKKYKITFLQPQVTQQQGAGEGGEAAASGGEEKGGARGRTVCVCPPAGQRVRAARGAGCKGSVAGCMALSQGARRRAEEARQRREGGRARARGRQAAGRARSRAAWQGRKGGRMQGQPGRTAPRSRPHTAVLRLYPASRAYSALCTRANQKKITQVHASYQNHVFPQ